VIAYQSGSSRGREKLAERRFRIRARVGRDVDRVAEPVDGLLAGEPLAHRRRHALDGGHLLEELHRRLVGAAVDRALEGGDRSRHRRVHVRERAGHDPGRERRRVQLVLGVQDHRHVERPRLLRRRRRPVQHRQEVLRVRERRVGGDDVQPVAPAVVARDDRGQLGHEPDGLPQLVRPVDRRLGGVRERQRGHGRSQHRHRGGPARGRVDDRLDARRQLSRRQLPPERRQLRGRRELALEQEVGRLLVGGVLGEIVDVVAAVHEDSALRVDRAELRLGHGDARQLDGLLRHRGERTRTGAIEVTRR
jgi:hypothetical protein